MKGFRKKWVLLMLMTTLLASLLTACSGNNGGNGTQPSSNGTDGNSSKDPVTLKVEVFDRGNAPGGAGPVTDNYWTQWIQKNFGDPNHIKMEFVPVPRNQEVDKLNVLMSTGDAPDIVFTYDKNTIYNYVKDGGLTELSSLIDQYGPNLKKFLGDEVLSYGVFNGEQYTIPAKRTLRYTQSTYIRKDWLDKLGLEAPKTTEEFYDVLKAFKEKDPGNTGGKVIPYAFSAFNGTVLTTPLVMIRSFLKEMSDEDFHALTGGVDLMKPGFKEGVQYLNKWNQEGLVSPDFALDKDGKQFESNVANGLVGAFTALAAHPALMQAGNVFDAMKGNVPGAEYMAIDPFTNEAGQTPKRIYEPIGIQVMIPKTSKHAAEAIKYLDWMSQPEVLFTLTNGIEGMHHTIQDGFPVAITTDEAKKTFYNNADIALVINGKDFGSQEKNLEAVALSFPEYKELAKQSMMNGSKDGYTPPHFERPIEADIKYNKVLQDKLQEILVMSVLAKNAEEFDKIYESGIQELLKLGGQAVIDERRAAYREMK